ncbi:MAG: nickel-dependent hydrogenase large subunit [Candidatus Eremiobacteraeota bacterium]|nr:nickel-dependent hydrogenase large subunit [Candidatus Eremiobacteraeota bacterium]
MNDHRGLTTIVVGPVHAGIIEPGRFTFSSGGESVVRLDAELGFSRRGVETALRGNDAVEAAPRVARICGACSASRSWAYALALEEIAGVRCGQAAELARVIIAELERAYNHVFDLAACCSAAGYALGQMTGLRIKESLHRLNAFAMQHRLLFDAIVPGGIRPGILEDPVWIRAQLRGLRRDCERFVEDVFENDSVRHRFERTGVVPPAAAEVLRASGPALRASGGSYDRRRDSPYGAYARFGVIGTRLQTGDVEARCRVKAGELLEAFDLCDGALAELGGAAFPKPQIVSSARGACIGAVEGPRGVESIQVEIDANGKIDAIAFVTASARNWPVVIEAMNGNIVPDFPLVNKSFNLCYACADL